MVGEGQKHIIIGLRDLYRDKASTGICSVSGGLQHRLDLVLATVAASGKASCIKQFPPATFKLHRSREIWGTVQLALACFEQM
jgi:hypothetical protein